MSLKDISNRLSNLPNSSRKSIYPSPVEGETWNVIENLRFRKDGDFPYWKIREGSDLVRNIAGSALTKFEFVTRVNGAKKNFLALHTTMGGVILHEYDTTGGTTGSGSLQFEINDPDTYIVDITFTPNSGSPFTVQVDAQTGDNEDLIDAFVDDLNANSNFNSNYTAYKESATEISILADTPSTGLDATLSTTIISGIIITGTTDITGAIDPISVNQIIPNGTVSTSSQIWMSQIGNFLYIFDTETDTYKYYNPSKDQTYDYGVRRPKPPTLNPNSIIPDSDPLMVSGTYRVIGIALVYLYDDGSISPPSAPLLYTNSDVNDSNNMYAAEVGKLRIDLPDMPDNVVDRYIVATKQYAPKSGYPNKTDDHWATFSDPKLQVYQLGIPDEIFDPSTTSNPNGYYYIADRVGTQGASYDYAKKDSELKTPLSSLIPMNAGIHNLVERGGFKPNSVATIKNSMVFGGYTAYRQKPTFFDHTSGQEFSDVDHIRVYPFYGFPTLNAWMGYLYAAMFQYTDGSKSSLQYYDWAFHINRYLDVTAHCLNSQVSKIIHCAYSPVNEEMIFGGFNGSAPNTEAISFVAGSGTGGSGLEHTLTLTIDGTQHTFTINHGGVTTIQQLVSAINSEITVAGSGPGVYTGAFAYVDKSENIKIRSLNPELDQASISIDVQSNLEDIFYSLIIAPSGNSLTYSGTTFNQNPYELFSIAESAISDPKSHGQAINLEFNTSPDNHKIYDIDFATLNPVESIDLREFIPTLVPPQNFTLNKQTRIYDQSNILAVVPTQIDTERSTIRYTMTVLTDRNIQYGYIQDSQDFFDGEFEIVNNTTICRNPFSVSYIDGVVYMQSNYGINAIERGSVQLVVDSDRYAEAQKELRSVSYNTDEQEIYFSLAGSNEVLILDLQAMGLRRFNYSGIGNISIVANLNNRLLYSSGNGLYKANPESNYDLSSKVTGVAISSYLTEYADKILIQELTVFGGNGECAAEIDYQDFRLQRPTPGQFSKSFNSNYSSGFITLEGEGAQFYPNALASMPRIKIELRPDSKNALSFMEQLYMISRPANNQTSARND